MLMGKEYMKPLNFQRYATRLSTESSREARKIRAVRMSPIHALPDKLQAKMSLIIFKFKGFYVISQSKYFSLPYTGEIFAVL